MNDEGVPRIGMAEDGSFESDDLAEAEWVRSLLGRLPEPQIPDDVSQGILAALSAESRVRSDSLVTTLPAESANIPPATPEHLGDVTHLGSNRRWWWAAGGVAAAGIGLALAVSALPNGSAPGGITAEAVNVEQHADGSSATIVPVVPVSSGSTYTAENVRVRVPQVISSSAGAAPPEVLRSTFAETPAGITSCLDGVGFPPQDLALLDIARFQGSPVAVLAYLTDAGEQTANVVVVGIRCSHTDPQVRHRDVADMNARDASEPE
jgi:hypothetical protein